MCCPWLSSVVCVEAVVLVGVGGGSRRRYPHCSVAGIARDIMHHAVDDVGQGGHVDEEAVEEHVVVGLDDGVWMVVLGPGSCSFHHALRSQDVSDVARDSRPVHSRRAFLGLLTLLLGLLLGCGEAAVVEQAEVSAESLP